MKKVILLSISLIIFTSCSTPQPHTRSIDRLKHEGHYGRVQHWEAHNRNPHPIIVNVPKHAPIITSDYKSRIGANGYKRGGWHRGVDIYHDTGTPIIAAADGEVVLAEVGHCWGPTMLIHHGTAENGKPLYVLYAHMRNMILKPGDKVKRGQQIAEMGDDIFNSCGGGLHHLHFQVSHNPNGIPVGWGWSYFVGDGWNAPNPHNYWADGEGQITCFDPDKTYRANGLTYPLKCDG